MPPRTARSRFRCRRGRHLMPLPPWRSRATGSTCSSRGSRDDGQRSVTSRNGPILLPRSACRNVPPPERRRACRPPVPSLPRRFAACQFRRPFRDTFPRIALMCSFTAVSVRPRSRAIPLFCLPSIRQVRISASRRDSWPELAAVALGGRVVSGRNRLMHSIPVCYWSYSVCSGGSGLGPKV
jgi:hypothetical protein